MSTQRSQAQIDSDLRQAQNEVTGLKARLTTLEANHAALQAAHAALLARFNALVDHHRRVTDKANHAHFFACQVNREGQFLRKDLGEPFTPEHLAMIPPFERAGHEH